MNLNVCLKTWMLNAGENTHTDVDEKCVFLRWQQNCNYFSFIENLDMGLIKSIANKTNLKENY